MKDRQAQPYKKNTDIYPRKNLKGKTQQNIPQYRCPKKIKGKTQKTNPPSSPTTTHSLSLSLMCYTSECVCFK